MLSESIFKSSVIHIGRFRCDAWHPEFAALGIASDWPFVSFPRAPIQLRFRDESVVGDQNTAVLFSFSQEYRRARIDPSGCRSVWIEIEPVVLREMLSSLDPPLQDLAPGHFPFQSAPVSSREFLGERVGLRNALAAKAGSAGCSLEIEERALNIAYGVLLAGHALRGMRPRPREQEASSRADIAEHARVVIARRFREFLPLREIARCVGVSVFHLCRAFRVHTGTSMHSYLDRLRVRAGADMLLETSDTVATTAFASGFSSESHFSNRFVREFAVRPGELRRRAARGEGWSFPPRPITPPGAHAWLRSSRGSGP